MKKILFLISVLVVGTITAQENKVKTYQIKSGYVKYKPLNKRVTGTHELWWDNYGEYVREERNLTTTTKFFGRKKESKEHTIIITKGELIWRADLSNNTATKSVNPMYHTVQDNMGEMSENEQQQMANSILGGLGGKKAGKEKFMGYTCEITKMWGSKVWMYKGVALKSESKMLGMKSGEEATVFKPNAAVNTSKFEPLPNVDYKADASWEAYEEEKKNPTKPLPYEFSKFKEKMHAYNPEGYQRMGLLNLKHGQMYTCSWLKNQEEAISVGVVSTDNKEEVNLEEMDRIKGFEKFSYKGHTCYYGVPEYEDEEVNQANTEPEEGMPTLTIVYKKQKMVMIVSKSSQASKQELLKIYDKIAL